MKDFSLKSVVAAASKTGLIDINYEQIDMTGLGSSMVFREAEIEAQARNVTIPELGLANMGIVCKYNRIDVVSMHQILSKLRKM